MNDKVMIYGCGGAGINIASRFEDNRSTSCGQGYAQLEITYVDTSRSNLRSLTALQEHTFLVDGLNGSGYVRAENHEPIADAIKPMLQKHKPGFLNIVVSSLSGGSGSVIAPELVSELLARGENVIVIGIGSSESGLEATNTLRSLKSYASISDFREQPVILSFIDNAAIGRKEADRQAGEVIIKLVALFSGMHDELDAADLHNFLRFHRVTGYLPSVASLRFFYQDQDIKAALEPTNGSLISVASLLPEGDESVFTERVGYRCRGYVSKENQEFISLSGPMNFAICDGDFGAAVKNFEKLTSEFEQELEAQRRSQKSVLSDRDRPTKSGLIL